MSSPLATEFERRIRDHRLIDIDAPWADEIVFPYYHGLSIINLAHTVIRLLDSQVPARGLGTSPLDARLWESLDDIRRVVLFITDGLGWRLLQDVIAEDPATAQVVADLTGNGTLTPITSIAPSTTAAALPAIWSGAGPAATGMVGTRLFLREYGVLASMLHYWPLAGRHRSEVLEDWGLEFDAFLPLETLGEALGARNIRSYLLLQKDLYGSGLSRIMHRGIRHVIRHSGYTDLWVELRNLLHKTRRNRCFVNIYWSAVDGVSHLFGTASEQTITEIRRQLTDLRDTLAAKGVGDKRTLFMLAADHGHTPVPDYVDITGHPALVEAQRCGVGGEGRFAHLYLRHDYRQPVVDYLRAQMGKRVVPLLPSEALAAGLYGPPPVYHETGPRLGDLSVISREGVCIGERPQHGNASISRHGGLSDREMLVPLLMRVL